MTTQATARLSIFTHDSCFDEAKVGTKISQSSMEDFGPSSRYCDICHLGFFVHDGECENAKWHDVSVQFIDADPCDCGERVMHNNGGNYHMTRYRLVSKIIATLTNEASTTTRCPTKEVTLYHFEINGITYKTDLEAVNLLREQIKALEDGDDGRIEVITAMMAVGLTVGRIVRA